MFEIFKFCVVFLYSFGLSLFLTGHGICLDSSQRQCAAVSINLLKKIYKNNCLILIRGLFILSRLFFSGSYFIFNTLKKDFKTNKIYFLHLLVIFLFFLKPLLGFCKKSSECTRTFNIDINPEAYFGENG